MYNLPFAPIVNLEGEFTVIFSSFFMRAGTTYDGSIAKNAWGGGKVYIVDLRKQVIFK